MAFGRLPNYDASETNDEDSGDYYRCQMKLGGLTETEEKMYFWIRTKPHGSDIFEVEAYFHFAYRFSG
uniref:Ig-like domain-containing protein n=1 Tax=Strongyloides papillosus TaxID=174720 RepID=A0A0N5BRM6_STREA